MSLTEERWEFVDVNLLFIGPRFLKSSISNRLNIIAVHSSKRLFAEARDSLH